MAFLKLFSRKSKKMEKAASPILPLGDEKFHEMVFFAEEREIRPRLPDLGGKRVLEISPRHKPFSPFLRDKGPKCIALLGGTREKEAAAGGKEATFILSHWEHLPFLDVSWDFVLLRAAFLKGGLGRVLREAARILKPQGMVLISDLHPFSLTVQKEHLKNPVGEEGVGPGFERYFKFYRDSGLRLQMVKEIFFEGSMKKFFLSEEEQKNFDFLRRTPFLILFMLRKE